MKKQDIIILTLVFIVLILVRVYSGIPNFNPLGAVALMGGMFLGKNKLAVLLPLGALFFGDLLLGFSSPTNMEYLFSTGFLFVYLAFLAIVLIGASFYNKVSLVSVLGGSILSAVAFFLISNMGSWLTLGYSKDFSGLLAAYEAGIPFFRATLVSLVVFSLAIYGIYALATKRKLVLTA